jgi:hypothetical protein
MEGTASHAAASRRDGDALQQRHHTAYGRGRYGPAAPCEGRRCGPWLSDPLRAAGFDGVIVMRMAGKDTYLQYVPNNFGAYGYWGAGWGAWGPGYYEPETIVRIETAAYSLQNNRLVYSALSRTVDPNSVRSLVSDVSKKVANAMQKQGVVVASSTQLPPTPAG